MQSTASTTSLVKKFDDQWNSGELKCLCNQALPYFLSNIPELDSFLNRFSELIGPESLDVMLKLFIYHQNMPFDMTSYMKSQSDYIMKNLSIQKEKDFKENSTGRQRAVGHWIQTYAHEHRHQSILLQVYCFEKVKDQIIGEIESALNQFQS
jgi:hypothetical protein